MFVVSRGCVSRVLKEAISREKSHRSKEALSVLRRGLLIGAFLLACPLQTSVAAPPLKSPTAAFPTSPVLNNGNLRASNSASNFEGVSLGELRANSGMPSKVVQASKAFSLSNGTVITVLAPPEWSPIGTRLVNLLRQSHERFEELFGEIPAFVVTLRLLEEETFFLSTGAPRWTNALFYRGQIIIPLAATEEIDFENISRSVRHEYTHAVIHALTAGKAPGWIDEGLAQLAEGTENSALRPALYDYLRDNRPVAFELMQGGFTRLETKMVAAAYAQSLIASQALVETFGYGRIAQYFQRLRLGEEHEDAFVGVFGLKEAIFEDRFAKKLTRWASTYEVMNRVPTGKTADKPTRAKREDNLGSIKARGP